MKRILAVITVSLGVVVAGLAAADRPIPVPYAPPTTGTAAASGTGAVEGKQEPNQPNYVWNGLRAALLFRLQAVQVTLDRLAVAQGPQPDAQDRQRLATVAHELRGVRHQLLSAVDVDIASTQDATEKFASSLRRLEERAAQLVEVM